MKLSKLKALVQKLEDDSTGTDPEVVLYSVHAHDDQFDIVENAERLSAQQMCFDGNYHLPIE